MPSSPLTIAIPADWTFNTAAQVAAHIAGEPLPPTSPWHVPQLLRDLEAAGGNYVNHLVAFDRGVIEDLDRDINRDRLPTLSYGGRPEPFNRVSKIVRRKLLALEWVFGRPLGVALLRLIERQCHGLFQYILQLGVVVELQKNLRTTAPDPRSLLPAAHDYARPIRAFPPRIGTASQPASKSVSQSRREMQIKALEGKLKRLDTLERFHDETLHANETLRELGDPSAKSVENTLHAFIGAYAHPEPLRRQLATLRALRRASFPPAAANSSKHAITGVALPEVKEEDVGLEDKEELESMACVKRLRYA